MSARRDHYSHTFYADPANANRFDERRFGGPIGELVASEQAAVVTGFIGPIGDRVMLDVGTGTGRAALLLAGGGAKVTGVDASEPMLAIARQRAARQGADVTFLQGDVHALDFSDRVFDVAVCLRVLMHSPRWQLCIAELCRVADHLVVLDYPSARSTALIQSWFRQLSHAVGAQNEPYRVFSDREITDALARHGFRVSSRHRQYVSPIALHKAIGSRRFTVGAERLIGRLGLSNWIGSPVTLVAERCAIS